VKRSLRRTLAVRLALTLAVGLAATSVAVWWGASRVLRGQMDQSIVAAAFLISTELTQGSATQCLAGTHPLSLDAVRYQQQINRFVVVRDPHCEAVLAIPGWASDLPADSGALETARAGGTSFSEARWHNLTVRSAYVAVPAHGSQDERVVQVGASLEPFHALQREMLAVLGGILVLGAGATLVGAGRLVDRAVRPVTEITEQATHIEAGTLAQRISAHATTDEYRGLVAVLNRMLDRLERAFAAQRRFTSDVSHELRTPLTALRGEIEVALRADRSPREYQRVMRSALEEIDRLTTMSEELLLITRAQAGLIEPQREPTSVAEVIEKALHQLRGRLEQKELSVERAFVRGDGAAPLDPQFVTRLVGELLENAINHSAPGGRITVRSETRPDGVYLVVEDDGPGIAAGDLPHIFDPYFRADQARSRGAGTGLGLTAAAAIARLHGGTIRASNRPEGGARFEVDLPTSHL
jgi:two-component system, OmpR family, sensor kinase